MVLSVVVRARHQCLSLALVILGCGGRAVGEYPQAVAGTGPSSSGASGVVASGGVAGAPTSAGGVLGSAGSAFGGSASSGGAGQADDLTPAGFPRCGELDPDRANDCVGLEHFSLTSQQISSLVDGSIGSGESGSIIVEGTNAGEEALDNVCIQVMVDEPRVILTEDGDWSNPTIRTVEPGWFSTFLGTFWVSYQPEIGEVVRFTFWTSFEGTNCLGSVLEADIPVHRWPPGT